MAEVVVDTLTNLLQPDVLLPAQDRPAHASATSQLPERRLYFAVLQDAVDCFQKYLVTADRRQRGLYLDAEAWILSRERGWPFAFENVCEQLNLDATYLRRGLLAWRDRELAARGLCFDRDQGRMGRPTGN